MLDQLLQHDLEIKADVPKATQSGCWHQDATQTNSNRHRLLQYDQLLYTSLTHVATQDTKDTSEDLLQHLLLKFYGNQMTFQYLYLIY